MWDTETLHVGWQCRQQCVSHSVRKWLTHNTCLNDLSTTGVNLRSNSVRHKCGPFTMSRHHWYSQPPSCSHRMPIALRGCSIGIKFRIPFSLSALLEMWACTVRPLHVDWYIIVPHTPGMVIELPGPLHIHIITYIDIVHVHVPFLLISYWYCTIS